MLAHAISRTTATSAISIFLRTDPRTARVYWDPFAAIGVSINWVVFELGKILLVGVLITIAQPYLMKENVCIGGSLLERRRRAQSVP